MEAANTMANRSSGSCTSQDHGKKERWARYSAFPPELRLQVIKAGIPYNTTCEVTRKQRFKTANDLIEVAHDLLLSSRQQKNSYERDPWANSESASTIKKMTEQAFFETVIFKLVTESALPTAFYHELSEASLVLLPKTIGTKARHLDIVHRVHGRYGPRSEQHPLKVPHLHKIAKSMDMLKLLFTNLKACILTLELHLLPLDVFMPQPFKPSIKVRYCGLRRQIPTSASSDQNWPPNLQACSMPSHQRAQEDRSSFAYDIHAHRSLCRKMEESCTKLSATAHWSKWTARR